MHVVYFPMLCRETLTKIAKTLVSTLIRYRSDTFAQGVGTKTNKRRDPCAYSFNVLQLSVWTSSMTQYTIDYQSTMANVTIAQSTATLLTLVITFLCYAGIAYEYFHAVQHDTLLNRSHRRLGCYKGHILNSQQTPLHDDVIKWKHFPRYLPFVRGIHRSSVNSPHKWPVTRSFDVFFDLRPNKRLSKQSWGWCFKTPSRLLWLHCKGSYPYVLAMEQILVSILDNMNVNVEEVKIFYNANGCPVKGMPPSCCILIIMFMSRMLW